ncbi:hypothetical protein EYF80_031654 [Liparis tanakae]|uniref:Uncharacterized protein n=1 Tax=Liparis tanakae TaxID=230148 RepID=A0A4Z2GXU4_9TELE|nr:hypothetical protein EYF80_031654 [Liparis tanakae]
MMRAGGEQEESRRRIEQEQSRRTRHDTPWELYLPAKILRRENGDGEKKEQRCLHIDRRRGRAGAVFSLIEKENVVKEKEDVMKV